MTSMMSVPASVVEIEGLNKKFSKYGILIDHVLKDISVSFPRSSIIGLVGRNGAGKTTLLRHVVGLLVPTSGQVFTLGCAAERLSSSELNRIGFLDQEIHFLDMTVGGHLRYVAGFYESWGSRTRRQFGRSFGS